MTAKAALRELMAEYARLRRIHGVNKDRPDYISAMNSARWAIWRLRKKLKSG